MELIKDRIVGVRSITTVVADITEFVCKRNHSLYESTISQSDISVPAGTCWSAAIIKA